MITTRTPSIKNNEIIQIKDKKQQQQQQQHAKRIIRGDTKVIREDIKFIPPLICIGIKRKLTISSQPAFAL